MARRITMTAKSKNDVDQHDSHIFVVQSSLERRISYCRFDHRMRPAARILVVAEIDERMRRLKASDFSRTRYRHVGRDTQSRALQHDLRLCA